jgi:hypothetical protein
MSLLLALNGVQCLWVLVKFEYSEQKVGMCHAQTEGAVDSYPSFGVTGTANFSKEIVGSFLRRAC